MRFTVTAWRHARALRHHSVPHHLHLRTVLPIRAKREHLIHLQSSRNLMRNKDHRHLPFELVDRLGEVLRRLLVEVGDRLIEDQNLRPLE